MPSSSISYLWRDTQAPKGFRAGVSLHGHTNQSEETLDHLANFGNQFPIMRPLLSRMEQRAEKNHGIRIDYARSYWTPPMTPKLAFDLETRQIEKLDLAPMVSITDHDNIKAPMLLRTVPGRFPFQSNGVRPTAACRPSISECITCPAPKPRSGWRPSRISLRIPATNA